MTVTAEKYNPYYPHSLRSKSTTPPVERGVNPTAFDVSGVPVGTSVQVQKWVGDDPERARLALERERREPKPRITLVAHLAQVLKKSGEADMVTSDEAPARSASSGSPDEEITLESLKERIRELGAIQ